jgi:hypothetical protein
MLKGNDPTQYLNQALQDLGLIANQARNLDEFWTLGCHAWAKQLNDWAIT